MNDELVEAVARIINPSSWRVMDSYLEQTKRKYAGQNAAYDPDNFKHKESMWMARAVIPLIRNAALDEAAEALCPAHGSLVTGAQKEARDIVLALKG